VKPNIVTKFAPYMTWIRFRKN